MIKASLAFARPLGRRALHLSAAGLALAAAVPLHAQQTRAGVDVRIGGDLATNPYLEEGADDVTVTANGELRPWLEFQDELTTLNLNGFAQVRQFAERYGTEDNYGANLGLSHRASERVVLTARAGAYSTASRLSTLLNQIGAGPGLPLPLDPGTIGIGDDVTVFGQRVRTTAFNAGVGAAITLDARNKLDLDTRVEDMSFDAPNTQDYRSHGAEMRFTHVVNAATSIGAVLGAQLTDYKDLVGGDSRTFNAMGSLTHRVGQYWTLEASLGAAFTNIAATPFIPEQDFTSLSSRASLCRRDEFRSMCLQYSRMPQSTALGSIRTSDTLTFDFNERLSARDTLSLGASYSRSGEAVTELVPVSTTEFVTTRFSFDRRFSDRVSGFINGSVAKIYRSDLSVDPSMSIGAGITVHLGQRR